MGNSWSLCNNTCMCHYVPAVYEYRLVPSFSLNLCYFVNGVHNALQVSTSSIWFPTCDVELDYLMSFLRLCRSRNNYNITHQYSIYMIDRYLVLKNTECSDGESTQRFLTYQVHCVLTKLTHLSSCWPVLAAALLLLLLLLLLLFIYY